MPDFHLHFVFQMLVMATIGLVLWEIKLAWCVDGLRYSRRKTSTVNSGRISGWWFQIRRGAMFIKLGSLCWCVVYGYSNRWLPWPPFILFIAAFDVGVVAQIFIMRRDLRRLERLAAMSVRQRVNRPA